MKEIPVMYLDNENTRNYDKNGELYIMLEGKIKHYNFDSLFTKIIEADIRLEINLQIDKLEISFDTELMLFEFLCKLCSIEKNKYKIMTAQNCQLNYVGIIKSILQLSSKIATKLTKSGTLESVKDLPAVANIITLLTITDFKRIFENFF